MQLGPSPAELLARALGDMRIGLPVAIGDGNGDFAVLAVETAIDERIRGFLDAPGSVLAVTARRAATLKARAYDGDIARLRIPRKIGPDWARSVADPSTDLDSPMKGPFATERSGTARLHRIAIALAREARLLPAILACPLRSRPGDPDIGALTRIDLDAAASGLDAAAPIAPVSVAALPLAGGGESRIRTFRASDGSDEHCAVEIGEPGRQDAPLARLHSACFTGDVLGSLKCDCGPQLRAALDAMAREGSGVLLYLHQEGRGIGLVNKVRAYSLQDRGFDTVDANHRLGFEDDERDFRAGAEILRQLGISRVRLMTNNPAKLDMLRAQGIAIAERVPLKVGRTEFNDSYLAVKERRSGHLR